MSYRAKHGVVHSKPWFCHADPADEGSSGARITVQCQIQLRGFFLLFFLQSSLLLFLPVPLIAKSVTREAAMIFAF